MISGQPTLPFAPTLEDSEPGINLVYSREDFSHIPMPEHAAEYPELRYMGSKHRLLPWIHGVLRGLDFDTAADPFVGSGCVAYLLKAMGKSVMASDFLNFPAVLAAATIANSRHRLDGAALKSLLAARRNGPHFIEQTFDRIFYTPEDLRFLDRVSANIEKLNHPHQRALARSALMRSCLKKQPRGFLPFPATSRAMMTAAAIYASPSRNIFLNRSKRSIGLYLTMAGATRLSTLTCLASKPKGVDLVYLDPPYVPRSDDNCYMKRYHFLEGLSCYWKGVRIMENTRVKKIEKPYTPFSYRKTAIEAFDRLFQLYRGKHYRSLLQLKRLSRPGNSRRLATPVQNDRDSLREAAPLSFRNSRTRVERAAVHEYLIVGR